MTGRLCGKVRWFTRRAARRARRRLPAEHLRPYWCAGCRGWHLGHLPAAVLTGAFAADEWYDPRRRAS